MGQHAVPLLLGIEQIGEGHHLLLEGGEFVERLPLTACVPRPLHSQKAHDARCRERHRTER